MNTSELLKRIEFDGIFEYGEGSKEYCFRTVDVESGNIFFGELYEDDIFDYVERVYGSDEEYEVTAAVVGIEIDGETREVVNVTITAEIKTSEDELMDIESVELEVSEIDEELINGLIEKIEDEL